MGFFNPFNHSLKIIQRSEYECGKSKMGLLVPGGSLTVVDGQPSAGDREGGKAADPWAD